jgi:hypothetical protein
LTADAARSFVARGLDERESNFLRLAEQTIYSRPRSPYLPLLRRAGCEFGDLAGSVKLAGLDATLLELRRAEVYVTFEELKGRTPIVRGDLVIEAKPEDFDNPLLRGGYRTQTSGSSGASAPAWVGIDYLRTRAVGSSLAFAAHGIAGAPSVVWRESLPAPTIGLILEDARAGQSFEHWFAPPLDRTWSSAASARIATELIVLAAMRAGMRIPRPEPLGYDEGRKIARWAERRLAQGGRCFIRAGVSNAMRVAAAASEAGIDLAGTTILGGGEPATEAKVGAIGRSGAKWIPGYASMEVGRVGMGCASPVDGTDVHFLEYATALITYPRTVAGLERAVDAFHFTSIVPGSPKILLNTEIDDYGVVEVRSCGCLFEKVGLKRHIRQIFSSRKLTGEGTTLVGSDMLRVLHEVLPRRFGGSALDYQLEEEEDDRGFTRLALIVSPRVALSSEEDLVETVLRELGNSNLARDIRSIWQRAGSVRVRRAQPSMALGGKVRPLVVKRKER